MAKKTIDEAIIDAKTRLDALIEAQKVDPNIIEVTSYGKTYLSSKKANQNHTDYEFISEYGGLFVQPYYKSEIESNGVKKELIIYCKPRQHRLIYRYQRRVATGIETCLYFTKLDVKIKSANLKETFFKACKKEIMKFLSENKGAVIDKTNLDPQLERLLSFS